MTHVMFDSADPGLIPRDAWAALGYDDGRYNTAKALRRYKRRVILTVFATNPNADGVDCEPGNANAAQTVAWAQRKLTRQPAFRPVLYGSRDRQVDARGQYGIPALLDELHKHNIPVNRVRLLSAHYGIGPHICSPVSCGANFHADGTQHTDRAQDRNLDESLLADNFFPAPHPRARPKLKAPAKPQPKVTAATVTSAIAGAITIACHSLGLRIDPAEAAAIATAAAALGGYFFPQKKPA